MSSWAHGPAAPETDTVNDNVIYLKFDEMTFPDTARFLTYKQRDREVLPTWPGTRWLK